MHNSYLAEATALLAEASRDLPQDVTEAAAIKVNMAQTYAILSLAQEVATATAAKAAIQ
ncbi:hypothetical protein CVCC1112_4260 [Paenarthrobacter nicotinovorans]|uniref:hypothetical protein n=1 Tax=Paenarthrobacter nicotinovorans TaxID=29320 RepID=UPI0007CC6F06|nr:hypothetical protein [Paenarthrobacter nicotinovorans]GAT89601.1 hypothetical protein CVCC1112_4260 [Paenarthrobacter nicotinovorans]